MSSVGKYLSKNQYIHFLSNQCTQRIQHFHITLLTSAQQHVHIQVHCFNYNIKKTLKCNSCMHFSAHSAQFNVSLNYMLYVYMENSSQLTITITIFLCSLYCTTIPKCWDLHVKCNANVTCTCATQLSLIASLIIIV